MAIDPRRVKELFVAALELPDPQARQAFLERECAADAELRQRLEALLKAHENPAAVLEQPLAAVDLPIATPAEERPAGPDLGETGYYQSPSEEVGSIIAGKYKLLEALGQGGMGDVFMAQQTAPVKRLVALKLIKPGMDSRQVLARFEAERQALALMDHPNIAKVLDAGATESGRPFFVMELVKGVPMTRFCDARQLSPRERLELFIPVCQAIQHAHQKGVIHRDIKPSNVLVALYDDRPVPKVIDFGVAKAAGSQLTDASLVTGFGAIVGTPEYMSPEQAQLNQLDIDTRSDVYALGVLLYELLTGTTPIDRKRLGQNALLEILRVIREEEPPRPSVRLSTCEMLASIAATRRTEPAKLARLLRGELDWIVMKCLEKERSRRYETANALARDLERYLHDEVVEARPPSTRYRLRKLVRRNKGRVLAGGLVAAMLFLVVGLISYGIWWAERQSAERRHEQALSAARKNEAFVATFDRIEAALRSGRLAEAGALLDQGRRQIEEATPPDLRERHDRLTRDERTLRELEKIFEERWMVSRSDTRIDSALAKRRYPPLFHSYDLAVGAEPATVTAEKVRQSIIAEALYSALTEWFFVDPEYPGLLAVVDRLDPEPGRTALRGVIANGETDRVKAIGKTIDGSQLAPAYAIGLGTHPAIEDGSRILKAAWATHPDSFPLALTISSHFHFAGNDVKEEALGWCRTAISLRPKNPLAHYHYAVALNFLPDMARSKADVANGIDEFRRTIRLAPQFAKAYGRLAYVLYMEGLNVEALAAAQKAIALDDQTESGLVVLFLYQMRDKKDYGEAARVYRQLRNIPRDVPGSVPSDGRLSSFSWGWLDESFPRLLDGLINEARPFEAYSLFVDSHNNDRGLAGISDDNPDKSLHYPAACAAAMAGTGQGLNAPLLSERTAIRKRAHEWLTSSFAVWKKHAAAPSIWSASIVGLAGSPYGEGLLPLASALAPISTVENTDPSTFFLVVHEGMKQWLIDPNLAGVREEQWLTKLPADEREQWRRFWKEVRCLRDETSAPKP